MSWSDVYRVVDAASTVSAIPLALVGFGVAFWQLNKTRTAAEASLKASQAAQRDANRAGIVVLLPHLLLIEGELDRALASGSRELALSWANHWRLQASTLNQHLTNVDLGIHAHLPALLQASVQAAVTTKKTLQRAGDVDLHRGTSGLRDKMGSVTSEIGGMMVHYANLPQIGGDS